MVDFGIRLPPGHRLVSLAERPDLAQPSAEHNVAVWPEFMDQGEVATRLFHHAFDDWPELQFILVGPADEIVATSNAMPLAWDGTNDGLPEGWDNQVVRSVVDMEGGRPVDTLGAMQIVVADAARGAGHAGTMILAMRAAASAAGYKAVIACVRPTLKHRYPLVPIERYAHWAREDGLPFDPWIRLHARLGARVVKAAPRSMTIRGTVREWESWIGMPFPESGEYVIDFATSPIHIDRDADQGVYHDQNVWMVHDLG